MTFMESLKVFFIKWKDFKSRSSRSEYTWVWVAIAVISVLLLVLPGIFIVFYGKLLGWTTSQVHDAADQMDLFWGIVTLLQVFFAIPCPILFLSPYPCPF